MVLGVLPPSSEQYDEEKGIKVVTEFKYNEESKMVKVLATGSRLINEALLIQWFIDIPCWHTVRMKSNDRQKNIIT